MEKYREFHRRSIADREGFWREQAAAIDWQTPFQRVLVLGGEAPAVEAAVQLAEAGQAAQVTLVHRKDAFKAPAERLARLDLVLDIAKPALAELAKVGFDPVFGARPLKRAIQQRIENPLSKLILEGRFGPKDTIQVKVDPVRAPGEFQFSRGK